ncbi:Ferrous-iron efflux pump FieF [Chlamydia abortus]|uniref:Cation diffusion facilitator family transporter n=1 Tax=Paenibacillus residui TaxID=629724 RepID=A0ABW3D5N5_9BACL|nr:cation diffusion facilitator family transporter [Paenibacillus sp. 32O-W]SHE13581.1 Ferrous-iron efflux pump FieF [Chlamydia abortus]
MESHGDPHKTSANNKSQSLFAAWISLISNALLTVIKLAVGWLFHSQVLVADGVHNAGDLIASAAALGSMRISNRPADKDHPYGHGKAEVIGAGLVAIILAIAAVWIGYHSFEALLGPPLTGAHWIALTAAAVSLVWKQLLFLYTIRLGRKTNSKGLIATAYDHLADVYASIAAVIGIGLGMVGAAYNIAWLGYGDPVAGIIVSLLVLKLAWDMGKEAIDILMERTVDPVKLRQFESIVRSYPEVKRIDRLRAREHGHYILVDLRIGVPGTMTVQEGHNISREIKHSIMEAHEEVDEVLVHLNPWYELSGEEQPSDEKDFFKDGK